mmetsp:Transcript_554/g.797  ORF Transcript_554/g.797 Transcript_554/m.797 type:complete len:145 (-) Transcript_554:358-792(-)
MALKQYLEKFYPALRGNIKGGNHPPPLFARVAADAAGYLQIGGVATILFADPLFNFLGYAQPPEIIERLRANQVQSFMMLFLFSSLAQNFANTGAFEIVLNGQLISSKLESGRMPTIPEIDELLTNAGLERVVENPAFVDGQKF